LPPSYKVNVFAYDSITNTYAVCNFTLVVLPSIADYGLGVVQKIATANTTVNKNSTAGGVVLFVKSVTGFAVGQQVIVAPNTTRMEIHTIGVVNSQPVPFLALNELLTYTHTAAQADPVAGNLVFCNSVEMPRGGHVTLAYYFYPLEPEPSVPNPITITVEPSSNFSKTASPIIDNSLTTLAYPGIAPIQLGSYVNDIIIPTTPTITRDALSSPVVVTLYLAAGLPAYDPNDVEPTSNHFLFQVKGTDTLNVVASSYTVVSASN
jgi:hypothetical protein